MRFPQPSDSFPGFVSLPSTRAHAERKVLVVLGIIVAALVLFAAIFSMSSDTEIALAGASSMTVLLVTTLFVIARPSLADATFVFMGLGLVYQVVVPWIYACRLAPIAWKADFLVENWNLLTRGNLYSLVGLCAYALGMWVCPRVRSKSSRKQLLRPDLMPKLITALLAIGGIGWLALALRSRFFGISMSSWGVLLGQPIGYRAPTRDYDFTAGGYGYLLELTFMPSLAVLVYALYRPNKSIFSLQLVALFYCVLLSDTFYGSRLLLAAAPISVLMLRSLLNERWSQSPRVRDPRRKPLKAGVMRMAALLALVFPAAVLFTGYRTGGVEWSLEDTDSIKYQSVNMFDTATTYYMVLDRVPNEIGYWNGASALTPILMRVPRAILPRKYEIMYAARRFVMLFYGYDQNVSGTVARGPNLLAEVYLNGGGWAVALCFFSLGLFNEYMSRKAYLSQSGNLFTIIYIAYLVYFLPFAWKCGISEAIVYVDVRLMVLLGTSVVVWLMSNKWRKYVGFHRAY